MLKTDLHIHTNAIHNFEGNYTPKQFIDKAIKLNFKVLAFTEHYFIGQNNPNYLKSYQETKDYAKEKGILLLPGVELRIPVKKNKSSKFNNYDILLINYEGDLSSIKTIEDLKKTKKENNLIIAAHPFYGVNSIGNKLKKYKELIDAVEHCHYYHKHYNLNKKAIRVSKKLKLPLIANSDAHRFFQMNTNYTLVDSKLDAESIIRAIKNNKTQIKTQPLSALRCLKITLAMSYLAIRNLIGEKFK